MHATVLVVIALSIMAFGLISKRIEKTPLTPPIFFVGCGLLVGQAWLGLLHVEVEGGFFELLAELTLVLVLFGDAARIDLRLLRKEHGLPVRMLGIGMPLTIALGTVLAVWMFEGFSFWQAAVLAAILAPTDAALGQAVVSNKRVPVRIRQALNVESGLNDGIALPLVVILVSFLGMAEEMHGADYWLGFTAKQVILGPIVGILVGFLGGKLVTWGQKSGWMSHIFQDLSAIGLSLAAFGIAGLVGGNGFIAAFTAGLTLGNTARSICSCLYEFGEAEGQLMNLLVFLIFGAAMVPAALGHVDGAIVLYALASLTVIRMLPVALSLIGARLRWDTVMFLGWFGPRGIASILFGLLVLEGAGVSAGEKISAIVTLTVLLSVVLHGLTAYPLASLYAARFESLKGEAPEKSPVAEMPLRLRSQTHD